jgi:iron complex outermembrane receptor protein
MQVKDPPTGATASSPWRVRSHTRAKRAAAPLLGAALVATALAASNDASADARTDARRYFKDGMSLIARGRYADGVRLLERANEILPHPNVTFNIARAYTQAGELSKAIDAYQQYLATDPPDRDEVAGVVRELTTRLDRERNEAAATEAGRKHFTSGMSLIEKGRYEEGIRELERANAIKPHPNVTFNIARAHADAKSYEKAIAAYRQYLESDPPDRKQVEAVLADLEQRYAAQRAATAATPAEPGAPANGAPSEPALTAPAVAAKTEPFGPKRAGAPAKPQSAGPATRDEDIYQETVVTASRGAQSPLDSPNSTTIITRQDIQLSGVTRIPELLRRVAGTDVMQITGGDTNVSMRGFNRRLSNKLLVLVNGRTVYNDILGSTFWETLSIDVDQVERIEVVRGPGSALYGADAFSGIVNIITIAPGEGRSGVRVGAGDHASAYGSVWATGRDGDFGYRASAGYTRYPRWTREFADTRVDATENFQDQDLGAESLRFDLRTSQRLGDKRELQVGGGFARTKLDFFGIGPFNDYGLVADVGDVTLAYRSEHVNFRTYYAGLFARAEANAAYVGHTRYPTDPSQNSVDAELEIVQDFRFPQALHHDVHIGLGYRLKNVDWSYLIDEPPIEHHGAVYLQDSIRIGDSLTLVGSGRLDYVPYLERVVASPRGSVIVRPAERQSIRASVSTAFRSPTFLESYLELPIQLQYPGVELLSAAEREDDPDFVLAPEQIFDVEASYLNQASDFFEFEVNAYYNRITNLIVLADPRTISLSNKLDGYGGINPETGRYSAGFGGFTNECDTYNVVGGELGTRVYPREGLDLFANYALNRSTQDRPSGCNVIEDERTSQHKVNAGVQVRTKLGLSGELTFHYQSDQKWTEQVPTLSGIDTRVFALPAYTLLNGRVGYRFFKDRAEVSATVFNALADVGGEPPQMHPFGNRIGRRMMGFFSYTL